MSSLCGLLNRVTGGGPPSRRMFDSMSFPPSYRVILGVGFLAVLLELCPTGQADAAGSASLAARPTPVNTIGDLQTQVRTTAAKVIPAVVSIASTVMVHDQTFSDEGLPFGMFKDVPPRRQYGQGSGVIVTSD